MAAYLSALLVCMKPLNLLLIFAMVALGIVFGAIPGLSATLGIALLLPITFGLSTETSFVMLLAIWIGGVSGTFISAVLIGIPGSSSAIATCFDGYPMTQKGQASKALGIGMTASFIGTVCSVAIATVLSPVIAEAALHLGPWEYFSLCFCAITLIASLSKGNIFKGIMSAGIGLLMGCVGMDPINGATRFTFGNVYLTSGISTVAQMLGMFAMCQIIRDNAKGEAKMPDVDVKNMKGLGIGFKDIIENSKTIIFAFASGLWIGFLPGMGSGISNTMFNIYVMLALCLLSLFMSVAGLPTSPLVLAFILSSKLERYFRQGISYAHGSYAPFFTRPISLILLIISVLCVFWPYISDHLKAKKAAKNPAPTAANVDVNDD